MNSIHILNEFKRSLILFFDDIISQFPSEGDLIVARIFLTDQISITTVMDTFTENLTKNMKKMITKRDDAFFLNNNVFSGIDDSKVSHFENIWQSDELDDEDRKTIWAWIDLFVNLSDKYNNV
jgi:hypothetical protein